MYKRHYLYEWMYKQSPLIFICRITKNEGLQNCIHPSPVFEITQLKKWKTEIYLFEFVYLFNIYMLVLPMLGTYDWLLEFLNFQLKNKKVLTVKGDDAATWIS